MRIYSGIGSDVSAVASGSPVLNKARRLVFVITTERKHYSVDYIDYIGILLGGLSDWSS